MRTLHVILVAAGVAAPALAQGTVSFHNNVPFATTAERRLFFGSGCVHAPGEPMDPLVGTDWVAQLYYGTQGTPAASLTAVASSPARFRVPTTTQPGTWSGGTRTLQGILPGQTATLQVRVWNGTLFPDGFAAVVAAGGLYGTSALFDYTVPSAGGMPLPSAFYMENFRGFLVLAPEPSSLALGTLGAAVLAFLHRRSRPGISFPGRHSEARVPSDRTRS